MTSTKDLNKWNLSKNKLARNETIYKKLRQAGFDVYLPQFNQQLNGEETLTEHLRIIRRCNFLILILSDTRGAYIEAGYAKALGKKVFALEVEETRKYSDWMEAFCDYIAKDVDDLIKHIKHEEKP